MFSRSSFHVKFIALALFICSLGTNRIVTADEEWVLQRTASYDIDVFRDISFLNEGQRGWIVGYIQTGRIHSGSALLKTTDSGRTWTEHEIGLNNVIEGIHFVDEHKGWVVGSAGSIAYSSDGGNSWILQDSGTESRLRDVCFVNETDGWAVGDNTILYTSNGGEMWQGAEIHYSARFNALAFPTEKNGQPSERNGWVVGNGGIIFRTVDGGSTWTSVDIPTSENLFDILFIDEQRGWITGKNGTILNTVNAGSTWTAQRSNTTQWLNSISFADDTTGWTVGSNGFVLHTTDGGQHWSQKPFPASATLYSVHFPETGQGWVCGAGGVLLQTADSGASWNYVMNSPNANLMDVAFVDPKNGWSCGWNGTILHTRDGGQEWIPLQSGLDDLLMGIDFIDLFHGWVITFEGNMLATNNGGQSWSLVQPPAGTFRGLDFVDLNTIWIVGEHSGLGTIFHGREAGTDWVVETQVSIGGPLHDVSFADKNNGWAVGAGGTILHTSDAGETWCVQNSEVTSELTHVYAVDSNRIWVAGNLDRLLTTTNGGEAWNYIDLHAGYTYGPVTFPSAQSGWVIGHSNADGSVLILNTTDGGANWHTSQMPSKEGFTAMSFVSSVEGWTVGEKGTVWYYTNLPFHSLSGHTVYCDNLHPVQDVTLTLSGYAADTVVTDEEGTFRFHNLRQGRNFCIQPGKDGAPQQVITSFDASLILNSLLGKYSFDACDSIAADVTGNGQLTGFDASTILRLVVGQDVEGLTGTWTFLPEAICFQDLLADQLDITLEGIIIGDVSQNWPGMPGSGVPEVIVSLPHTGASAGSEFLVLLFASSISFTCLDSLDILSYQAQINYDPSLLHVTTLTDSGLVTENWGPLVFSINNDSGHVFIAKAGTHPLPWCGSSPAPLIGIQFRVNPEAPSGATSPLTVANMIFNEGSPWTDTHDGFFRVLKHSISGTVSYCSTGIAVPGVSLSLAGDTSYTVSTAETGWYIFNNLEEGEDYCVASLTKHVVPSHVVTSFDASLILRHQAGTFKLGDCGSAAGDVNMDGITNSDDARLISQYAMGDGERALKRTGSWLFIPESICYDDLPFDQRDQTFEALIYGDVSGNYPGPLGSQEVPWILVHIPDDSVDPGATIGLYVVVDSFSADHIDSLGVYACDLQLRYDPSILSAFLVSTEGLTTENCELITSRIDEENGLISISLADAQPLSHITSADIPLVRIDFYVKKEVPPGTETTINVTDAIFNEGSPQTFTNDGLLYIQGKRISGTVRYCDTQRPIERAMLQIFSFTTERVWTDSKGEYQFSDLLPGGRYCIFPLHGEPLASDQHVISSLDAALIFRHIVNLQIFSPCDSIAADVSSDGTLTAYDASIILRYVACEGCGESLLPPGITGTWHFEPQLRCFENLTYNETSDYDAIMYGDVSQNWPGLSLSQKTNVTDFQIGQPKLTPRIKNSFTLPIEVDHPDDIIAADISLTYNPNDFSAVRASTTSRTCGWEIAYHNSNAGRMKIAMAGSNEPTGPGSIVEVEFETESSLNPEALSVIEISVLFNEGQIPSPPPIQYSLKSCLSLPPNYTLGQNHPNPFNPTTSIQYSVTADHSLHHITLKIYNLLGQEVKSLVDEPQEPGYYTVTWNGTDNEGYPVASGIYFYRLTGENGNEQNSSMLSQSAWSNTKRMLLLK